MYFFTEGGMIMNDGFSGGFGGGINGSPGGLSGFMRPAGSQGGLWNEDMCGGRVEKSDSGAPKVIASKNIIEFSVHFGCYNRMGFFGCEFYDFSVKRDKEGGPFVLEFRDHRIETDERLCSDIQQIIDENNLSLNNGVVRYTHGLPPEYQPYDFDAVYDSGEKLQFYIQGEPTAQWCVSLRKALCRELVRNGIEDLLPPKEDRNVARFDLGFQEWPLKTMYATIRTEDDVPGERPVHYFKSVWNYETGESVYDATIVIPDGFYAHITELAEKTDLRECSNGQIEPFEQERSPFGKPGIPVISWCCEGESTKQFNTFVWGDEINEDHIKIASVIREYLESVFEGVESER